VGEASMEKERVEQELVTVEETPEARSTLKGAAAAASASPGPSPHQEDKLRDSIKAEAKEMSFKQAMQERRAKQRSAKSEAMGLGVGSPASHAMGSVSLGDQPAKLALLGHMEARFETGDYLPERDKHSTNLPTKPPPDAAPQPGNKQQPAAGANQPRASPPNSRGCG
jgi:hypothetical protein